MSNMTSQQHLMQLEMMIHMTQMKCNFLLMESESIHPGQIALLMTMRDMGLTNQRALARSMNCSAASVGVSVKRLERAGLLRKQADEQDMRTTRVALTEQGLDFAQRCEELVNTVAERKYAGLGQEELDRLEDYLTRISANLEDYHGNLAMRKQERESNQGDWDFPGRWGAHERRPAGEWGQAPDRRRGREMTPDSGRSAGRSRAAGRNPSAETKPATAGRPPGGAEKAPEAKESKERKDRKKANDTGDTDNK